MLICIFNYRNDENATRWLNLLSPYFDTVVLDSGNDKKNDNFIQLPNIFYSGLFNEMKKLSERKDYEWVGLICSDVTVDDENARKLITQLQWVQTTSNVGQYQPSFDEGSYKWRGNNRTEKYKYEGKHLLDGPIVFMRNDLLMKYPYIDVNVNLYGCGIGRCFSVLSERNGYLNLFDNTVEVHHPEGTGYNKKESKEQTDRYIDYFVRFYGMSEESLNRNRKNNSIGDISYEIKYKDDIEQSLDDSEETTKNKKVVYTCITGDYDYLEDPTVVSEGYDYICFSDSVDYSGDVWTIRPIPSELKEFSNVKQQRLVKICPHKYLKKYKLSVWVDANIDIRTDLDSFIKEYCSHRTKSVFIPLHPKRNCIYKEAIACIKLGKDMSNSINRQVSAYREEKYPENNGLVQTGIIIRKHNSDYCAKLMNAWADELIEYSHRDQMSFNYCLWKVGDGGFEFIPSTVYNKKDFAILQHKTRRKSPSNLPVFYPSKKAMLPSTTYIFNCGYPWMVDMYKDVFGKISTVSVIDTQYSDYSRGFKKVIDDINNRKSDYIIILKSNVNMFGNSVIGDEIIRRIKKIITNNKDIGVYSPSVVSDYTNPSIRKHRDGERTVSVVGDDFIVINTAYISCIPEYDFSRCPSGNGFMDKVCSIVKNNSGEVVVDDGVYVTTQYIRKYTQDALEQQKKAFIRYNADKQIPLKDVR